MKIPFAFKIKVGSSEQQSKLDSGPASCPDNVAASVNEDSPIRGLCDIYSPEKIFKSHVRDITDVLLEMGKLTPTQYEQLCSELEENQSSDAAGLLLQKCWANRDEIQTAKAGLYGLEFRRIDAQSVPKEIFEKLHIDFIRNNRLVPISINDNKLLVATSEPSNIIAIEDVKRQTQMAVELVVCSDEDIDALCGQFEKKEADTSLVDDIINDMTEVEIIRDDNSEVAEDLEKMAGQSPVIKFVNYLISNAIHEGASDIHIEPKDTISKIRYRIDGVLFETTQAPLKMHAAVVSRVKIMSNLDISERRLPQDGKISVNVGGRGIDLRVSILPTSHGEKVVIRILDSKSIMRGLNELGMDPDVCEAFRQQIDMPHGILLVTGPTGSGKSTTLYSALSEMDGNSMNISTVEDPVEYKLGFCSQVQVHEKIGLDFASALRSLLRQDPDIIMIGEIRDNETARIAVQAALTGHLVLSTLHTNDATSSITRLVNIGIDSYLIAASLNGVLAQRLVRKICPKCKQQYQVPENMRKYVEKAGIAPNELFHGKGCESCRSSGYVGRIGIYELLVIDEKFRDMINKDPSASNMRQTFYENKAVGMFGDGIKKVRQGLTTIEEVLRVTEVYGKSENEAFVENIH